MRCEKNDKSGRQGVISFSAKEIFQKYNGQASKDFGQNYIFSTAVNNRIVSFAGDLCGKEVLEIGPGPGGLTVEIISQNPKRLTLIEVDNIWSQAWRDMSEQNDVIHVIAQDVLKTDLSLIDAEVVISNLPYNISSQVLLKLLPMMGKYTKLVLMFQKELADRITAHPGTKQYGRLSVMAQMKACISKKMELSPNNFFPAPKVYSEVLVFEPNYDASDASFEAMNALTTAAFANRRKYVINSLTRAFKDVDFAKLFQQLNIREDARAEQISLEQYIRISRVIS